MKVEISDDMGNLLLATRSLYVMSYRENSPIWCVQKLFKMSLYSHSNNRRDFLSMIYYVFHIFTCHPIKRFSILPLELRKEISDLSKMCTIKIRKFSLHYIQRTLWLHHTSWSHCQLEDLRIISDLTFLKFISLLFIA